MQHRFFEAIHSLIADQADAAYRIATLGAGVASGAAASYSSDLSLSALGLSLAGLLGAFSGAMVSLSFLTVRNRRHAASILTCGTLTGGYMSPLVVAWMGLAGSVDVAVAFGIGGTLQWAVPVLVGKFKAKSEQEASNDT